MGPAGRACPCEALFGPAWFTVRRDRWPDGAVTDDDRVVVPAAVSVLAADDRRRVAVTRQWIHVRHETQRRLPAGRIDGDEGPRELGEETRIPGHAVAPLDTIDRADSSADHRGRAFLATGLTLGAPDRWAGEADREPHRVPFAERGDMVSPGQQPHAGSSFAVLSAHAKGLVE